MKRVNRIKYAMMAVLMLAFTAMLTSCGSDDNNSNVITPGGTGTTKTLKTVKVRYLAQVKDAESIRKVTKDGGPIYVRYVGSDGSIKQETLTSFTNVIDRTVEYAVGDSTWFGMQFIAVPKDSAEIASITDSLNLNVVLVTRVWGTYSDNSVDSVDIGRNTSSLNYLNVTFTGFRDEKYAGGSGIVSNNVTVAQCVNTSTGRFGGVMFSCFSGLVQKNRTAIQVNDYILANSFWANHKFTAE